MTSNAPIGPSTQVEVWWSVPDQTSRWLSERGRSRVRAFGFGVPIGSLGGLIGLRGAQFRLPVLTGVLG